MSQTWIIKDTAPVDEASWSLSVDIAFTSHGGSYYTGIEIGSFPAGNFLRYTTEGGAIDIASFTYGSPFVWYDDAYKTLVFDTAPAGDLLTWLQKNADKSDPEYLTRKSELTSVADAIRAKGGTTDPLVYPDGFVTAIQSIDTTGGRKPATVTITSSDYTGDRYGNFIFPTLEGHIGRYDFSRESFTFPVTINTVIGGLVIISPENLPGMPGERNVIGSEVSRNYGQFIVLVTSPQASIDIINTD